MTNYTENQVKAMVEGYNAVAGQDYNERSAWLTRFADANEFSVNSVRAVLVRAGVYKKKETSEAGSKGASKEELVSAFNAVTGKKLTSLKNASRKDLQALWDYIRTASDANDLENGR